MTARRTDLVQRKCSKGCGRTLGAANKSGVCSQCQCGYVPVPKGAPARPNAKAGVRAEKPAALVVARQPGPGGESAVDRFRAVAPLLGFDGEGMLNRFAQAWLDTLHDAALERDESIAPAPRRARNVTVTSQALPATPKAPTVRLRAENRDTPAAAVDDGAATHSE